jgi:hypothetical protein
MIDKQEGLYFREIVRLSPVGLIDFRPVHVSVAFKLLSLPPRRASMHMVRGLVMII